MLSRQIHFHDPRPPHEVQFAFERLWMILLSPVAGERLLTLQGSFKKGAASYAFRLRFEADLAQTNAYSLHLEATWPEPGQGAGVPGWFDFWTAGLKPAPPGDAPGPRYEAMVQQTLAVEAHLTSVPLIQQEILRALRAGATYSTAHKEGGTELRHGGGLFTRADYGESSQREHFSSETAFLQFLRNFYDWETSCHTYPEKVSEYVAWKLILRLLRPPAACGKLAHAIRGWFS